MENSEEVRVLQLAVTLRITTSNGFPAKDSWVWGERASEVSTWNLVIFAPPALNGRDYRTPTIPNTTPSTLISCEHEQAVVQP